MDGADYLTRLRKVGSELRRWDGMELPGPGERHPVLQKFVEVCGALGLPVNAAKKVVQDFDGAILGGELDGIRGSLGVAPKKATNSWARHAPCYPSIKLRMWLASNGAAMSASPLDSGDRCSLCWNRYLLSS